MNRRITARPGRPSTGARQRLGRVRHGLVLVGPLVVGVATGVRGWLVDAIEFRLVHVALDPLVLYRKEGTDVLRKKLKGLSADAMRVLIRQHHIPCQNAGKRKKDELIEVIVRYAANTDIGGVDEAA